MAAWREEAQQHQVPLEIPEALISNDALRIVEKLNEMGHLAMSWVAAFVTLRWAQSPKILMS